MDMEKENTPALDPSLIHARPTLFDNQLLSYRDAAKYLGISESYLRRLKGRNQISFVPMGNRGVRFRVMSLNRWIERTEVQT